MSVELIAVKSLREARSCSDDWTGLTDPAERRRRQNRLHQRAWRRRQAEKAGAVSKKPRDGDQAEYQPSPSIESVHVDTLNVYALDVQRGLDEHLAVDREFPVVPFERLKPFSYWEQLRARVQALDIARGVQLRPKPSSSLIYDFHITEEGTQRFPPVFTYLASDYDGSNLPAVFFPLSPDHRLLVLIQLNAFRAMLTNMAMLRIIDRLPTECGMVLYAKDFPPPPDVLPPSLQDTWLQQNTPHDMWIDLIPFPKMRNNILAYGTAIDEDDFCVDIMGGLYEGFNDIEVNGMLVWGEPWSETGWEVTAGFAKKWGFLLKGCDTLIEATNKYRAARGEDRLVVEF